MRRSSFFLRALPVVATGAAASFGLFAGCANPEVDAAIAALGPEPNGPGRGPLHRPGQPCLLCHDGGVASNMFAAGTVYATPYSKIPVNGVSITLTDALGHQITRSTNCAGNFYVQGDVVLAYPLRAEITCTFPDGTKHRSVMGSRIDRDGSCAGCHVGSPSESSPGRVSCAQFEPNPAFTTPPNCTGGH